MKYELFKIFGAHNRIENSISGIKFTVYAPNAKSISVIGDFNNWNKTANYLKKINDKGIWTIFIPDLKEGERYKYCITSMWNEVFFKCDPFAFFSEIKPDITSKIYNPFKEFQWNDKKWLEKKKKSCIFSSPISIYEVNLSSWKKNLPNSQEEFLNYKEIAELLIPHLKEMGFTHVELLPIVEHSSDLSLGYQCLSYFSITSRYGTPNDFKYFINKCHENNIGVILDWVPCHFSKEINGLYRFDGTPLFEYRDGILEEDSFSNIAHFNVKKKFVKEFLISNACFFFKYFHIDGLRINNISNFLYLEYQKKSNKIKNSLLGNIKLESIEFLKELNEIIFKKFNSPLMIAEEETNSSIITKPTFKNGLGFNFQWNVNWMNDMLRFLSLSSDDRERYHNLLTFSLIYAFSKNFILPLSHEEILYGKKSLFDKIGGNYNEKFIILRMFYAFMFGYPGKKLFFMGSELVPLKEWKCNNHLEWNFLTCPKHLSIKKCLTDLHLIYKNEPALYELDFSPDSFKWINHQNHSQKIISFIRMSKKSDDFILVICNFTTNEFINHHIGVPKMAIYKEIFNSDKDIYSGNNHINKKNIKCINKELDEQPFSISINIAPMTTIFLKPVKI